MPKRPDVLLVSTADWDNPFWTNKQHVAVELAKVGCRVLYVESQGLRQPTLTGRDMGRIWRRLKQGLRPPRAVRPNLWVWSPLVLPLHGYAVVRGLNRILLALGWRLAAALSGVKPTLLWTYSPLTTQLYDITSFDQVVYHAVDDIKAQPGMPREAIAAGESDLAAKADIVFCTAPAIQTRLAPLNPETYFLPNVADFDHFNHALDEATIVPEDLARIPEPRIGFIGAVSAYKLDLRLLRAVADRRPDWSFVLIGEVGEGEPRTDIDEILGASNIHLLGGRPYADLPAYLKGMAVALLPSAINEYTQSMFPMKFFEYLAAGRPVVATPLPALTQYHHVASIAAGADAFEAAIASAMAGEGPDLDTRLTAARAQTYAIRTAAMLAHMERVATAKS